MWRGNKRSSKLIYTTNKMKTTIIFLAALFFGGQVYCQDWQNVGTTSTNLVVEQDLFIDQGTGEMYLAFIESTTQRTTVKKWINDTWEVQGNSNFGTGDNQSVVKLACFNGESYAAIKYTIGANYYIRIYHLVSGTWTAMGDQAYQTNAGDEFSIEIGIDGKVYLMFYKIGSGFGIVDNLNVVEVTETSQIQVGGVVAMNVAYAYDLAIDPIGDLRVTTDVFDGSQYELYLMQYAFGGWFGPSYQISPGETYYRAKIVANAPVTNENRAAFLDWPGNLTVNRSNAGSVVFTTSIANNVIEFDFTSATAEDFIFYTTTTGNQVLSVDGSGATSQVGSSGVGFGPITSPKIETWNDRIVVSFIQSGAVVVREINNEATLSVGAPFQMCEQVTTASVIPFISIDDNNYSHENIVLSVTSNSPVVIPNLNINLLGTFPDYSLELTSLVVLGDQLAQLQVQLEENSVVTESQILDLLVINKPDPTIVLPLDEYCENVGLVNLNGMASPNGGAWSGTGVVSGPKFNPDLAGPGTHTIQYSLTNTAGCVGTEVIEITVFDAPEVMFTVTSAACGDNDGEIDATVTGGTTPYTYYWSNGQQIQDIYGLESGIYTLFVSDMNGCEATATASTVSSGFTMDGNVTNVTCYGGTDGAVDMLLDSDDLLLIDNIQWSNGSTTPDIDNLSAGTYEVYIEGIDGCVSTAVFVVTSPTAIGTTMYAADTDCGLTNGASSCVTGGGIMPYDYQWYYSATNTPIGANQSFINDLGKGAYHVVISDQNGCEYIGHSIVSEHGGPEIDVVSVTNSGCSSDGSVDITIVSAQPIASVLWSNGLTTEDVSGLTSGYYTVTVTDLAGCSGLAAAEVVSGVPAPVSICLVTVDTLTNNNMVVWEKPVATDIESFNVYRETATAGEFLLVGNVLYDDESIFIDPVASPAIRSWRYKIASVNSCGGESELSDFHKTMHVTISLGLGGSVNLNWDEYQGFSFTAYDVYRHTNQDGWQLIQSMPTNLFSFTEVPPSLDGLQYMIGVTPPSTCTSTTGKAQDHNSTRSNKTASVFDDGTNSVDQIQSGNGLIIYPNPTIGQLNIVLENQDESGFNIQLFDARGELIFNGQSFDATYMLNLSEFADGVYTLIIVTNSQTITNRVIKN